MNKNLNENVSVKVGFIGCGKMASAIINGVINSDFIDKSNILGSEINEEFAQSASKRLDIKVVCDNKFLVEQSDVIFVATKPNAVEGIMKDISEYLTEDKLVVSIAAGVKTSAIESVIGERRVVRVMPNTPALLMEGMSGICHGKYAKEDDVEFVYNLLLNIGKCIKIDENQIDIVTAISGSGPAFFYKVIEDMARAGEKLGLEYKKSLILATQTALGSAKMVFERGDLSVQTLIDNVATKGGCTHVGITVMNDENSQKLFYDVIEQTTKKAHALGGNK